MTFYIKIMRNFPILKTQCLIIMICSWNKLYIYIYITYYDLTSHYKKLSLVTSKRPNNYQDLVSHNNVKLPHNETFYHNYK